MLFWLLPALLVSQHWFSPQSDQELKAQTPVIAQHCITPEDDSAPNPFVRSDISAEEALQISRLRESVTQQPLATNAMPIAFPRPVLLGQSLPDDRFDDSLEPDSPLPVMPRTQSPLSSARVHSGFTLRYYSGIVSDACSAGCDRCRDLLFITSFVYLSVLCFSCLNQ